MIKFYGTVDKVQSNDKGIVFARLTDKNNNGSYLVNSKATDGLFSGTKLEVGMLISANLEQDGKLYKFKNLIKDYTRRDVPKVSKDDLNINYDRISAVTIADKKHSSIKDLETFNEKVVEYTKEISNLRISLKQDHKDLVDYIFGYTFGKALERAVNKATTKTPIDKIMLSTAESFKFLLPSFSVEVKKDEESSSTSDLKERSSKTTVDEKNSDEPPWKEIDSELNEKLEVAIDTFG